MYGILQALYSDILCSGILLSGIHFVVFYGLVFFQHTKAPVPPEADSSLFLRPDEQPSFSSVQLEPFEEVEDDEEQGSIPEDHFEIKTTEGKSRKMKGVTRARMSLMIGKQIIL